MTLKIAMLALTLAAAWFLLFRPRRQATRPKPPTPKRTSPTSTAALERCPQCGVYRLPGGQCACNPSSTPES